MLDSAGGAPRVGRTASLFFIEDGPRTPRAARSFIKVGAPRLGPQVCYQSREVEPSHNWDRVCHTEMAHRASRGVQLVHLAEAEHAGGTACVASL